MASVTPVFTDAATLEEVMDVLQEHMPIQMEGDFQPETLFEILVHAASNAQSIEQTSKTLDKSPTGSPVGKLSPHTEAGSPDSWWWYESDSDSSVDSWIQFRNASGNLQEEHVSQE